MTLRQRCQQLFAVCQVAGHQSIRALAQATLLSKSSVHRLLHRIDRRNQYPESSLWETPAGQQWLRLLVIAAVFVFSLQSGVGCERLSQFFHLLRLQHHIGVSPSALRALRTKIEHQIITYQQLQLSQLTAHQRSVELCAAVDETFFDQVLLVMLDLPSGYILLEEFHSDRQYTTWQVAAQSALAQLGFHVKYLVSDRAKALIKLALTELGCPNIADLFHALRSLSKGIGFELAQKLSQWEKLLDLAHQKSAPAPILERIIAQTELFKTAQTTYLSLLHDLTQSLHPFSLFDLQPVTTLQVNALLHQHLHSLSVLQQTYQLKDSRQSLAKFSALIPDLASVVDVWWSWVDACLVSISPDSSTTNWVKQQLLPAFYWSSQVNRTKTPALRAAYQLAASQAHEAFLAHPFTVSLTADALQQWSDWAVWMVSKFQRSTSAVEGRNGYLSQLYCNHRGLSSRRLQVMTVLHNFYLQRGNGSTAAQRLFGRSFPDLFDWTVAHLGELPHPRRPRPRANPIPN